MLRIVVNRLRATLCLRSVLMLVVVSGNAHAETSIRERETLSELQETVAKYRGEVERYRLEVQSNSQLQGRVSALEMKLSGH